MYRPAADWNPQQARFREIIKNRDCFTKAIELCLSLHGFVHQSHVSDARKKTLADMVFDGLRDKDYAVMPTPKDVTIAWNLWHITRIEDITMNLLVADGEQVLNREWLEKLGTGTTDTGNAMSDSEIMTLSSELNTSALWAYRAAVGRRSRDIVRNFKPDDLRRKFSERQTSRIVEQGCLTHHPDSIWLKDFWGKKDVAGILLLPLTRHQAGHLNDCLKIKEKITR
jgi:hypothetical protein